MEKFKVIIEFQNGETIKLNNVEQISKYDISDYTTIKLSIPIKEIKNYHVIFERKNKIKNKRN